MSGKDHPRASTRGVRSRSASTAYDEIYGAEPENLGVTTDSQSSFVFVSFHDCVRAKDLSVFLTCARSSPSLDPSSSLLPACTGTLERRRLWSRPQSLPQVPPAKKHRIVREDSTR